VMRALFSGDAHHYQSSLKKSFTVLFYGHRDFCGKSGENPAKCGKWKWLNSGYLQSLQNLRKPLKISYLSYDSPTLTAELQARLE